LVADGGDELAATDAKQATGAGISVDGLTVVVGEKHRAARPGQERREFRHRRHYTAIAIAAIGLAAIGVASVATLKSTSIESRVWLKTNSLKL
jgi:hypothetical protein